jgi:hypothetical protein
MKFKGHGIVWDGENNRPLCAFEKGELETEDKRTVEILKVRGYAFDEEVPKPLELLKVADLKEIAKEKGIEGFEAMTKAKLLEAIKKADEAADIYDLGEDEENKNIEGAE